MEERRGVSVSESVLFSASQVDDAGLVWCCSGVTALNAGISLITVLSFSSGETRDARVAGAREASNRV